MEPLGLTDAAATGDRKLALEALRSVLARSIMDAEPREVAPLARQMSLVLKELDEMSASKSAEGGSFLDRLAQRDKDRLAAS